MFATRANQENAVYAQQTAAAAKQLNQGADGHMLKTPANKAPKTPFKVPLNDENAIFGGGRTGLKGKQDGLFGEGKSGKVDRNAFITPAGPRDRAPLGNKTTNAKGTSFHPPAPPTQGKGSARPTSPRLRRGKIKVHEVESTTAENEDGVSDIEYMPPREVPLPDHPDDWPHDRTYPQFEGKNLTRGWWSEFAQQKGDDDDTDFSDLEDKLKMIERRQKKEQTGKLSPAVKKSGLQKTTKDPLTGTHAPSVNAKNAVSALSHTPRPISKPRSTVPGAITQSKAPSLPTSKKASGNAQVPLGNPRHGAARAASNSTLGYSKGRVVSASSRKPLSEVAGRQVSLKGNAGESPVKTPLDDLFSLSRILDLGCEDNDLGGGAPVNGSDEDETEEFQLEL